MRAIAQYPFLRYLVFFIVGALARNYYGPSNEISYFWLILPVTVYLLIHFAPYFKLKYILLGVFGLGTLGFLGFLHIWNINSINDTSNFAKINHIKYLKILANGRLEEKPKSYKLLAKVIAVIDSQGTEHSTTGNALIYFKKGEINKNLKYGCEILIANKLALLEGAKNPFEFDYKKYCYRQQIEYQCFIGKSDYVIIGQNKLNWLYQKAFLINELADNILKKHLSNSQEYAVATAMILGVRDDIDNDLMKAYSAAGAIHVLSVSGLHVGVLYGIMAWLLSFLLKKGNVGKWFFCLIILCLLWFYALLTGLSAPVLRSTMMFSIFLIADTLHRDQNNINTLAFSAFCLLLFDPYYIWNIGFLLSYLAILGMILIQPAINPLVIINKSKSWLHWLGDRLWKVTTVAIAAQIATFPLTIYYFHQFPVYFLVVNPIVILLSTVVLVFGLGFILIIEILPIFISTWLTKFYFWCVFALNKTVLFTESLPYSVAKYLFFNEWQLILFYLFFVCILMIYFSKKYKYVKLSIGLGFLLLVFSFAHFWKHYDQNLVYIASVPKANAMVYLQGQKAKILGDSDFLNNKKNLQFKLDGYFSAHCISNVETRLQSNSNEILEIKGLKFLMIKNGKSVFKDCPPVDVLVLQHKYIDIEKQILPYYNFKYIVIDGTVSSFYAHKMKSILSNNGIYGHYVLEDGGLSL